MTDDHGRPPTDDHHAERRPGGRGLTAPLLLSYGVALAFLAGLVYAGGVWNQLANTRILQILIRGGVIALTDADAGPIRGLPDQKYWVAANDPVDWGLVGLAVLVLLAVFGIKAVQTHGLARFAGIDGTLGQHARASWYGLGIGRILPFHGGDVATAAVLRGQGAPLSRAALVPFLERGLFIFEVAVFALLGLWFIGWSGWIAQLFWGVVILAAATVYTRGVGGGRQITDRRAARRDVWGALRATERWGVFATRQGVLSVTSLGLEHVALLFVTMAFTSTHVILAAGPLSGVVLLGLAGLVAGYITRLVQVTPGGIGQFETAFAAALYVAGVGLPEAVTIALLYSLLYHVTAGMLVGVVLLGRGVETTFGEVLELYREGAPAEEPEQAEATTVASGRRTDDEQSEREGTTDA